MISGYGVPIRGGCDKSCLEEDSACHRWVEDGTRWLSVHLKIGKARNLRKHKFFSFDQYFPLAAFAINASSHAATHHSYLDLQCIFSVQIQAQRPGWPL